MPDSKAHASFAVTEGRQYACDVVHDRRSLDPEYVLRPRNLLLPRGRRVVHRTDPTTASRARERIAHRGKGAGDRTTDAITRAVEHRIGQGRLARIRARPRPASGG